MKWNHEGNKYTCDYCDYQASNPSNLYQHTRALHECVKHACNQCDKQYTDKGHLKHHIRTKHEGVRYECNHSNCHYKAWKKESLKSHIERKHSHGDSRSRGPHAAEPRSRGPTSNPILLSPKSLAKALKSHK